MKKPVKNINTKSVLLWVVIMLAVSYFSPTDATDESRWNRSGMDMHIDHGTGCHYLAGGGFFGKQVLIPRLDKDGKHVCEKK